MTLTVTSNIQSQIDEYKKWLEKEHVFTYAYEKDTHLYYYVGYTRFNKLSGLVILSETDQDPVRLRNAAQSVFQFNRIVIESSSELISNINRPIEEVEKGKRLLQQAQQNASFQMQSQSEDISIIMNAIDLTIQSIPELQTIFKQIQGLERKVLDEGILRDADVEQMIHYNLQHYMTMYRQGQAQIEILPHLERVRQHIEVLEGQLSNTTDQQLRRELFNFLNAMTIDKNVQKLRESQSTFQQDGQGKPISLPSGEEGVHQMAAYLREYMQYKFNTEIIKDFRNL